jgi:hypothetical protein
VGAQRDRMAAQDRRGVDELHMSARLRARWMMRPTAQGTPSSSRSWRAGPAGNTSRLPVCLVLLLESSALEKSSVTPISLHRPWPQLGASTAAVAEGVRKSRGSLSVLSMKHRG